jgi:predicted secreted hydrolase
MTKPEIGESHPERSRRALPTINAEARIKNAKNVIRHSSFGFDSGFWFRISSFILCFLPMLAHAADFQQVLGPRQWSFPRDHGRHDGFQIEWWYFTGNLKDQAGRKFGYQLTFFRSALSPREVTRPSPWASSSVYFAHAAISDIQSQHFIFKDRLERERPKLAFASDKNLDVLLLDWSAKLDDGKIHLHSAERDFQIDLTCSDGRGPILQGPGGVNAKGHEPGQASYYYSMTRLKTAGVLAVGEKQFSVQGNTWMDHEFSSNALGKDQVGWDWMGLQLNDGTDLMIYRMRNAAGESDHLSGTEITPDSQPHYLSAADISLDGSNPWKSPVSGSSYPQQWSLRCKGLAPLTVRSLMPGQELNTKESTNVTYFEGASEVLDEKGLPTGEGYLEITSSLTSQTVQSPRFGPTGDEQK